MAKVDIEKLRQIENLTDMMSARSRNPYDIEKVPTGIKALDGELHGGIPRGQLTIVAGYEGSGKSHFISQIIAEAIDLGKTAFLLSGEQTAGQSQHILACQLCGKTLMEQKTARSGIKYAALNSEVEQIITDYYKDQVLYYEPYKDPKNAYTLLQKHMELAAEAGVEVFIIDNLMTLSSIYASDVSGAGLSDNTIQSGIAQWLEKFAGDRDVYVILAAHKRKTMQQGYNPNLNQEILGSSNVANSAGLIIHYDAAPAYEGDKDFTGRRSKISKNRLFGYKNFTGIDTLYDMDTHRLYTGENDRDYRWMNRWAELKVGGKLNGK
jgi:twinkle protein